MTATPRLVGNRYELGELIGYGGMAEVHRGRDLRLGRDVAIKILRADLANDPAFLIRFRREAQSAAGLNYPAIVAVYDTGEDPGLNGNGEVPYIVMEFVEGRTLRDVLKEQGRLPIRRAEEVTAEVCGALDYSHRNGIVHRDIKPANVMITPAGAVKVMDFGIARAMASNAATVTQTAAVIGTAQYLSPEQARGEPVDARSDVYSTGCLLYELITGNPPFVGDSPVAVAYQHVRENASVPSSLNPEVPRALDSIVMKALAKNPLNRYQSAAEMRSDLQRALADQPVSAEAVMTDQERTQFIPRSPSHLAGGGVLPPGDDDDPRSEEDERRRKRLIWMGIVAVLLLVIGGAAYAIALLGKSDKAKTIEVPSLVGQTPAAANQALTKLGFAPDNNPTNTAGPCDATGGKVAEGQICSQDPAAHSKVTKDTQITFKLYKKPTKQVPQLSGLTVAAATDKLHQNGLPAPKVVQQNSDTVDQGLVIKSDPTAYTGVPVNTVVTIYVSTGKSAVPTLIGKQLDAAKQLLSQQGWTTPPEVNYKTTHDQSLGGVVLDQYPLPNASYPKDTLITLTVWQYSAPGPTCTTPPTSPNTSPSTTPPTSPSTSPRTSPSIPTIPNNLAPPTGTGTGSGSALPPCH
jgi:serine/threonine-protein kinase